MTNTSTVWFSRARLLRVLAGVLAAVILAACMVPRDDTNAGPTPADPQATASAPADGTKTIEEFESDINGAVAIAQDYWTQRFREAGSTFEPIRRVLPYQRDGEVACGGQGVPRNNAVYCPAGDFIAYDIRWAVAAFQQVGDAFIFYLLGHEYAHGVQARLGISHQFSIEHELQADCMAGAYLGDSVRADELILDEGDLEELRAGLHAVADEPNQPWFAPEAHGTADQRTDAFFAGYQKSLEACELA